MRLVIGVDGGGTRIRAVVVDEGGRELGRAESAGAVITTDGPEATAKAVDDAVRDAAARAHTELPVNGLWAGLAGAGLEEGRLAVARMLDAAGLAENVVVGTDVEAAFRHAFGDGAGILLIAGTGSIAWARNPEGVVTRAGGWGEKLGDEGSGFAIGMGALRAIARAEDGRGPKTTLRESVLQHLGLGDARELVSWTSAARKRDVAALAPVVCSESARGDGVARGVVAAAVTDLSRHVAAVLERGGPWPGRPALVLGGGLLHDGGLLRRAVAEELAASPVELTTTVVDAALGAAQMALVLLDR